MYGNKGVQLYQYFGLLLFYIFEANLKGPSIKKGLCKRQNYFFCLI